MHPIDTRMEYGTEATDIERQPAEVDLALKLFRLGMEPVDKLGREDTDPDDPNLALKAWWPSVSPSRQLVGTASEIPPRLLWNGRVRSGIRKSFSYSKSGLRITGLVRGSTNRPLGFTRDHHTTEHRSTEQ